MCISVRKSIACAAFALARLRPSAAGGCRTPRSVMDDLASVHLSDAALPSPLLGLETAVKQPLGDARSATEECDCVPHVGNLFLKEMASTPRRVALCHRVTLEGKALPPGTWEIVYDEEGWAAIVDTEDDNVDPILAEDFLNRILCRSACGEDMVCEVSGGKRRLWSLATKKRQHVALAAAFDVGPTRQEHKLRCFRLAWPRQRCHFYFEVVALYRWMRLECYSGEPSKWVCNRKHVGQGI